MRERLRQAEHNLNLLEEDDGGKKIYWLDLVASDHPLHYTRVEIGAGRSELATFKAAKRRLAKLQRDIEKEIARREK